jgi:cytochrome P450
MSMLLELGNGGLPEVLPKTYLVHNYQLVKDILRNSAIFTSYQIGFDNYKELIRVLKIAAVELEGDVLFSDFEQHSTLRGILLQNYIRISQYIPELVKKVICEHFKELQSAPRICIAHEIATAISEKIFLELSGIARIEQYSKFRGFFKCIRSVLNAIDNNLSKCNSQELVKHWEFTFSTVIQKLNKPDHTYPNLLSGLAMDKEITLEQKAIMILAFIRAGIENPRSFIVSAVIRYFQYPELYEENNIQFLNEVMRYDCPAKITARYISDDIEVGGLTLKKGYKVWLSFRLANFSEEVFNESFSFKLRKINPNLSLGIGPHFCIGKDLTYKLTSSIIDYVKTNNYSFLQDINYLLDDSVVFRRYINPIYLHCNTKV